MSVWSGLAAGGVGIALVLFAVGMPLWEWREDDSSVFEVWSYRTFSAGHYFDNRSTAQTPDESRNYSYPQLGPLQHNMTKAMSDYGTYILLGLVAGAAGMALSGVTAFRRIRGIFAGVAYLGACASILYASFILLFAIPTAARLDINPGIIELSGRTYDNTITWGPEMGWYLPIGSGLAFAWSSSDVWHLRPGKRPLPKKVEVELKPLPQATAPLPPPPLEAEAVPVREPLIEEVFLIGSNGLLIKHMSRTLMTDKDRDVVGSMISAISSFVREAFSERDGEVHEVSLGDHRFVMCNESGIVVAVLVTSGDTGQIVPRLRHLLAVLIERYGARLSAWQGEPLDGIEDELHVLWDPYHLPPPPAE